MTHIEVSNNEMNTDSSGLTDIMQMLSLLTVASQKSGSDSVNKLSASRLNKLFRNSNLIRKIVCHYPTEAKSLGYIIKDKDGNEVDSNDELILEAFTEASIYARLYGKSYLILETQKDLDQPLRKNEVIINYEIKTILSRDGDYFIDGDIYRYHNSKVLIFLGSKTYIEFARIDDPHYSDSIIQGIYEALQQFKESNKYALYILKNLSYLTIGQKGLGTKLSTDGGKAKVFERMSSVSLNRDINRIITYDADTEKVNFINQTLAGVKDLIQEIKLLFAAETGYPYKELFDDTNYQGMSSGIQNQLVVRFLWAKRVKTWSENNLKKNYTLLFRRLYGDVYNIEIPFIVELTEIEKAELEDKGAARLDKLVKNKIITPKEARSGYQSDHYSLNIELDESDFRMMNEEQVTNQEKETDLIPNRTEEEIENQDQKESIYKPAPEKDLEISDREYDVLADVSLADIEAALEDEKWLTKD